MGSDELFSGVLPFFHVAEERSFRRAAQRLGVTAAAVSKAVLKLEEQLGVKLLARTSRTVAVTPEGALFAERCREAIATMQAGRELVSRAQRQPSGELHLTLPFIVGRLVARELGALATRYPRLTFRVSTTDRLVRLLEDNVDVAIRIGSLESSSLIARHLRGSRWVTVASPAYLAQHGPPSHPDELAQHHCLQFVAPSGRPRDWAFVDRSTGAVKSTHLKGRLKIDQGEHLLDAAISGMGVCQVLDFMLADPLSKGQLVEVLGTWAAPGPPIHALTTRERSRAPAVVALVKHLVDTFRRVDPISSAG
ncbi:MAG: yafC4 [Myxococcaceae bacterium]|nr:yafC4 [Myxococcaceae bacterium]